MSASTDLAPTPSNSRLTGYIGWLLAALFFSYGWVLRVSPSVMVEQLMRDFAVTGAIIGNLSAVYFYAYAVLQMPVGLAHDRWGPRRVLTVMSLVAGSGALVFAMAPSVEIAYIGRALIGTGSAFALVGSMVLASRWLPQRNFAFFTGIALSIGLLGGAAGQGPLAFLVQMLGWREAMTIVAGGAVVLSLLIWILTRDHPPQSPLKKPPSTEKPVGALAALWQVARNRQTVYVSMFACLVGAPSLAFGALGGVPYTMQAFDISRTEAAFSMSFTLFGWMIGGPFWGWISDRLQRRKLPIIIGALITTSSMAAAIYMPGINLELFRIFLFINGFAAGTMAISYALIKEHNAGNGSGAAMGLVNMMAVAGGAIFQPIVGLLLDNQWQGVLVDGARIYSQEAYANAFILLPTLYFGSLVFGLCIRETHGRPVIKARLEK